MRRRGFTDLVSGIPLAAITSEKSAKSSFDMESPNFATLQTNSTGGGVTTQSQNGGKTLENGLEHSNHTKHSSSKDRHHSSSKDKHHSSSKDKHHSSSSSKDKSSSSSSKDKHHSSSSSSKDKHHSSSSSKDKDRHSSSSKHKDGHKHSSSSSSSKHKDGSSSSSSKHKDGSSSKHKDSDKHKHSSSSSDKHKHSSSSDKHSSSSEKLKHSSSLSSEKKVEQKPEAMEVKVEKESPMKVTSQTVAMTVKSETVQVKSEPMDTSMTSPHKSDSTFSSPKKTVIKDEDSEDDMPLTARLDNKPKVVKRAIESDDEDDVPLTARMDKKVKKESPVKRKAQSDEDDEYAPEKKKKKKEKEGKKVKKEGKEAKKAGKKGNQEVEKKPGKKSKKEAQEEEEKYKWWEEVGKREDGKKWEFLEHKGPVFAPDYEPVPSHVRFFYNGKHMKLTPDTEEVATFYARMLDHDYTSKEVFNNNFFKDWRKVMTKEEKEVITDLTKCNFKEIADYFKEQSEIRKSMSKEEKNKIKEQNAKIQEEYGFCTMDGHKEKIGNFRIEPPGLFRGRGSHPKMGMLKKRTLPEDVIINCSKGAKVPEPPKGHKWKEVRHDNSVTWLACWTENVQGSTKYVMLNAASRLKGEKDWQKYETARKLHKCVDKIRANYRDDWKSKEMRLRQRAVALYFIDKLALRAGNEKDEDTADTVGCCSLRVEHLTLNEQMGNMENVVEFDFLGKDSIRYYNKVSVEKRVFKNLQLFMQNKAPSDDVFDRLNTGILNKYLQSLMDGLTAKVFRTFNASKTLQEQLKLLTNPDDPVPAKMLSYNRANRAVAVLCNHQRAVPKNFDKQMENLQVKIDSKKDAIRVAKKDLKAAKADYKATKNERLRKVVDTKKKAVERLEQQLTKLEVQATDKDENKEIALGTSKLNYLDPRISVAWCKKWDVPIEKIYNKTQREKFAWAIEMTDEDFEF